MMHGNKIRLQNRKETVEPAQGPKQIHEGRGRRGERIGRGQITGGRRDICFVSKTGYRLIVARQKDRETKIYTYIYRERDREIERAEQKVSKMWKIKMLNWKRLTLSQATEL